MKFNQNIHAICTLTEILPKVPSVRKTDFDFFFFDFTKQGLSNVLCNTASAIFMLLSCNSIIVTLYYSFLNVM